MLTEFPPLIKYFADAARHASPVPSRRWAGSAAITDQTLSQARADFDTNLQLLQRPLKQLGRAAPYLIDSLKLVITAPYPIDNIPKVIRGDYINTSATFDLTLSAIDNAFLTAPECPECCAHSSRLGAAIRRR